LASRKSTYRFYPRLPRCTSTLIEHKMGRKVGFLVGNKKFSCVAYGSLSIPKHCNVTFLWSSSNTWTKKGLCRKIAGGHSRASALSLLPNPHRLKYFLNPHSVPLTCICGSNCSSAKRNEKSPNILSIHFFSSHK